jgi:hypothetical protein
MNRFSHPCHIYPRLYPLGPPVIASEKKTSLVPPPTAAELEPASSVEAVGASRPQTRRRSSRTRPREATGTSSLRSIHWRRRRRRPPVRRRTGLPLRAPPPTRRTRAVARRAPAPPSEDGAVPWPPAEGAWEARHEEGPRGADIPTADVGGDGGTGAPSTRRTLGRAGTAMGACLALLHRVGASPRGWGRRQCRRLGKTVSWCSKLVVLRPATSWTRGGGGVAASRVESEVTCLRSPAVVAPLRSRPPPCLPDFSPEIVHCRCAFSSQFVVPRRRRPSVWRLGAAGKSPSAASFPAWAGGGNHLHLCCPLYCYLIGVGWRLLDWGGVEWRSVADLDRFLRAART